MTGCMTVVMFFKEEVVFVSDDSSDVSSCAICWLERDDVLLAQRCINIGTV